nr:hypothetical protein [uncultured Rhodopila sp.]
MEGGSPALIWERWTIPMYQAQKRYWTDHPRPDQWLRMLVGAKYKLPRQKKTPPARKDGKSAVTLDWSALDAPLTAVELGNAGPAIPIRG